MLFDWTGDMILAVLTELTIVLDIFQLKSLLQPSCVNKINDNEVRQGLHNETKYLCCCQQQYFFNHVYKHNKFILCTISYA